jgi:hypothetical protein
MSFDEQPDGDIHGECAAEIEKLNDQVINLAYLLQRAINQISIYDTAKKSILPIKAIQYLKQENLLRSPIDRAFVAFQQEASSAALNELNAAPDGWQPIETVPLDATQVLLYHTDGRVLHAEWSDVDDCAPMWRGVLCGIGYDNDWEFTHWMPLPKGPTK